MYTNIIQESFKRHFETFFKSKNVFWHKGAFVGSHNGLFTYSYAFEKKFNNFTELNIVFYVAPVFCVRHPKIAYEAGYGLTMREFIILENVDICMIISDKTDIDSVMDNYLRLMKKCFDKYYDLSSVTEYCEKMLLMGIKIVEFFSANPQYTQLLQKKLSDIDFVDICYYYLKAAGTERCKQFVMELVSGLRTTLYDGMKYDKLLGSNKKFIDTDLDIIDRIFKNYNRTTEFLESLLLNNDSYFIEIGKKFKNSKIEGSKIVSNLLNLAEKVG